MASDTMKDKGRGRVNAIKKVEAASAIPTARRS